MAKILSCKAILRKEPQHMATRCNFIKDAFDSCFSRKWIMKTAEDVGLLQRKRKVDVVAFFWTIVLGFGTGVHRTIAEMRRLFESNTGVKLVVSSFYDRFTPQLCRFLKEAVAYACEHLSEPVEKLKGNLSGFKDLVIADSTVFRLHDMLGNVYKARRNRHYDSAMKVHVVTSVLGRSPKSVLLSSERTWDGKQLRIGPWVKGKLLLFDMGYFSYSLFERVGRSDGFFITRLKDNANPKILFSHRAHRGRCKPIETRKLRSILSRLKRKFIDVQIEVVVKRRAYLGERSKATKTFRLVGVMNEETGMHHLYVTNVPPAKLSAGDVARTYAARWGVELLFKQLKSHFRIHDIPSRKRYVVEALVYAAILTLVLSRDLLFTMRRRLKISIKRTPEQRWAAVFQSVATSLLHMLITRPQRGLAAMWEKLEKFLAHEILDPNRHRTLRLNYGRA